MVEGGRLGPDSLVGERLEEGDERVLVGVGEAEVADVRVQLGVREVAAAAVEVHDLAQGQLAAVVEVGRGQLDVAESRHLEGPLDDLGRDAGQPGDRERVAERVVAAVPGVGGRRPDAVVGEAGVEEPTVLAVDRAACVHVRDRGVGHLGAAVTLVATALAPEDAEPTLFQVAKRGVVSAHEPVEPGLPGDEGRFPGLDRQPPEEREVELHHRV